MESEEELPAISEGNIMGEARGEASGDAGYK